MPFSENQTGPTPWTPGPRRALAITRILTVHEQAFTCPDHPERSGDFVVIETRDWVNLIALTDEPRPRLILVEQFRFGTAQNTLEIPGGVVDPGEDPVSAGPRELLEETGYAGRTPRVLGTADANPAIMTNKATTLLVEGCNRIAEPAFDPHEQLVTRLVDPADVPGMVARGDISNAVVIAALFHWIAGTGGG
jgi:8-oxo-dGTP pyrophosphatase MutT (NUDIX family)